MTIPAQSIKILNGCDQIDGNPDACDDGGFEKLN